MRRIRDSYAVIASTLALVIALTTGGAYAVDKIGSKQLKPRAVGAKHLKRGAVTHRHLRRKSVRAAQLGPKSVRAAQLAPDAVQSSSIADGAVTSDEIGEGEVTPEEVTFPEPATIKVPAGAPLTATAGNSYVRVAAVGAYAKSDPESALSVTWTGTAEAGFAPCVFQLRVDGQPTDGGEVFVSNGTSTSVAATALFKGLAAGERQVEVWARTTNPGAEYPCTVSPATAPIGQTFVVGEQV